MSIMEDMRNVLDEAQYVQTHERLDLIAVWHGGHTINFYHVNEGENYNCLSPTTVRNVGDFAEDSATLEEVKESIERTFSEANDH